MSASLNNHHEQYTLSNKMGDFVWGHVVTGRTYAHRHFEQRNVPNESYLGHVVLGIIESIPVIGSLCAVVDWRFHSWTNRKDIEKVDSIAQKNIQTAISEKKLIQNSRYVEVKQPLSEPLQTTLTTSNIHMYRAVLGDGNCFYTSIATGLLEASSNDKEFANSLIEKIDTLMARRPTIDTPISLASEYPSFFSNLQYQPKTSNEISELTSKLTTCLGNINKENLESYLANNDLIFSFIQILREITAQAIRESPNDFWLLLESLKANFEKEKFPEKIDQTNIERILAEYILTTGLKRKEGFEYAIGILLNTLDFPVWLIDLESHRTTVLGPQTKSTNWENCRMNLIRQEDHFYTGYP